jgi:hypothetical protein
LSCYTRQSLSLPCSYRDVHNKGSLCRAPRHKHTAKGPHDHGYEIKFGRFGIRPKLTTPGPAPTRTPPPPPFPCFRPTRCHPDVVEPHRRPLRSLPLHSPISLPCRSTPPSNLRMAATAPRTSLLQPAAGHHGCMRVRRPELDLAPVSRPLLRPHPRSRRPYSGPVSGTPAPVGPVSGAPALAPSAPPLLWPVPASLPCPRLLLPCPICKE